MSSEAAYFPNALTSVADGPESIDNQPQTDPNVSIEEQDQTLPIETQSGILVELAETSDAVLMEQIYRGVQEALGALFRRYARLVRSVALRILRDEAEADDLLQEVFLFIFRRAELFDRSKGTARSWIVQLTYHRAIDRRRYLTSRHFYNSLELEGPATNTTEPRIEIAFYEESLEGTLGKATLRKIEDSLSDDQRETLNLYFFEGYTLEEIAARVGQSIGNIRNHYYRALEKMRGQVFPTKLRSK